MTTVDRSRTDAPHALLPAALRSGAAALLVTLVGALVRTPFQSSGPQRWGLAGDASAVELLALVTFVAVGTAVVFGVVVRRCLRRPRGALAGPALALALVGAASVIVFWTGLPVVLAGGAAVLASRARAGGTRAPAAVAALVLAALVAVAAVWLALAG